MKRFIIFLSLSSLMQFGYAESDSGIETIQEYLEFAEYAEGSISTEQLASIEQDKIFFVDTRNKGQYDAGHIPGAVNIEWRQVLSRRNEIPSDKPVVLYCETGLLSSKAHLALKVAGRENIKVLWGGYLMWSTRQSFEEAKEHKNTPDNKPHSIR